MVHLAVWNSLIGNAIRVPAETAKEVLTRSRRRCCLCFWLNGLDQVRKGEIAHLDQDASNNAVENLAFLCFEHHDEYDGRTSQSKGLQEAEVRHWRDMLYEEMAYQFGLHPRRSLSLEITRFLLVPKDRVSSPKSGGD